MLPLEKNYDYETEPLTAGVVFNPGTKLEEVEKAVIIETLKDRRYNRTHTAKALGIGIRTLQRKLKKYGVSHWGLKEDLRA